MKHQLSDSILGNQHINLPASVEQRISVEWGTDTITELILWAIAHERDRMWNRCKNDTLLCNYDDEIRAMIYDD